MDLHQEVKPFVAYAIIGIVTLFALGLIENSYKQTENLYQAAADQDSRSFNQLLTLVKK